MPNLSTESSDNKPPYGEVDKSPEPAHATTGSSTTPKSRLTKDAKNDCEWPSCVYVVSPIVGRPNYRSMDEVAG